MGNELAGSHQFLKLHSGSVRCEFGVLLPTWSDDDVLIGFLEIARRDRLGGVPSRLRVVVIQKDANLILAGASADVVGAGMKRLEGETAVVLNDGGRSQRRIARQCGFDVAAGRRAVLTGGLRPYLYAAALICVVLVAIAMGGLVLRSIVSGEWAGALFLAGFAALFAWQVGGFVTRNKPLTYTFDSLPAALLP